MGRLHSWLRKIHSLQKPWEECMSLKFLHVLSCSLKLQPTFILIFKTMVETFMQKYFSLTFDFIRAA